MAATRKKVSRARSSQATSRKRVARAAAPAARRRKASKRASLPRREITALACLAVAVFLGFVVYVDWSGGPLGRWLADALRSLVGMLVYVVPPLLVYIAYVLAVKEEKRPCRATSVGLGLLCLAFMLAATADVFGLFAGSRPVDMFDADYLR
ncbi:MAG: DNA translocase FtsK 4TM domain-containing protein, partial [Actinobacteria bacterium]|nr:DNA translocase FtsK 4TM domain-containing protein [Actinomycetota bacterium]